ncbi:hypothetical protein EJ08DRAFT_691268 [Tothia fuscella]|uniref:Uncharacterized protein n=1 Tax=Tothia fuscella TaxID=1048955 RepID=A0A9P4P2A5_9PEZI|nr:hypothetical protein EJ08DRAFT_691268 [Tothia fuscella]
MDKSEPAEIVHDPRPTTVDASDSFITSNHTSSLPVIRRQSSNSVLTSVNTMDNSQSATVLRASPPTIAVASGVSITTELNPHPPRCFLLELPREIRNLIYVFVSLLLACQQLSAEFTEHLVKYSFCLIFDFNDVIHNSRVKGWKPSPILKQKFEFIIIKLDLDNYAAFDVVNDQLKYIIWVLANIIIGFDNVQELTIVIAGSSIPVSHYALHVGTSNKRVRNHEKKHREDEWACIIGAI